MTTSPEEMALVSQTVTEVLDVMWPEYRVQRWWRTPHPGDGGRSPQDVLLDGETTRVLRRALAVVSGEQSMGWAADCLRGVLRETMEGREGRNSPEKALGGP